MPAPDGLMCAGEFLIAADLRRHHNFAGRRLGADYLALVLEGPCDLNAEVDVHRGAGLSSMLIEKTIMPAGRQAVRATEELPNEIKRRLPGPANVSTEHVASHGGER